MAQPGGSRKVGRNKDKCKTYRAAGTRLHNKVTKVAQHIQHKGTDDLVAHKTLKTLLMKGLGK